MSANPVIPASSSILSAHHLGHFLAAKYGWAEDAEWSLIRAGINHSYRVKVGEQRFVFRLYSLGWRSVPEIEEELRLILHLQTAGLSVSCPLPDLKGIYIQEIQAPEGLRYGVLFSYAAGEKTQSMPPESHEQIGRLMAQMHQSTLGLQLQRITYTPEALLLDALPQLSRFLTTDSAEWLFMQKAQEEALSLLRNVQGDQLRRGAVHLDIWFDNLNIDAEGRATLFDFDFCGNGWLCLDIAYYSMQLQQIEREPERAAQCLEAFFRGYESLVSISAEEKRLLPMLGISLYFFYLSVQCRRYENWSNVFLHADYLRRFIRGLVQRYYDLHQLGS